MRHLLQIEPMSEGHLDRVMEIEQASAPHPWTRGMFRDELANADGRLYLVARAETLVVGFCGALMVPAIGGAGEAHVTNVAVDPAHRRFGIARTLLLALFACARDRGVSAATLEVRVSNTAARNLYQSLGFAPVGVRPRYYEHREDALILWKHDL